ncbi:MAG: energy transducer TonB [Ferruginibacter sp.]
MKIRFLLGFLCLFMLSINLYAQKRYPSYPLRDETGKIKPVKEPEIPAGCFGCMLQEAPKPLNLKEVKAEIGYPQVAKEAGITGTVLLRILVSEEGKYKKHLVAKPGHPLLLKEVEKHISKLVFTPVMQGNKTISFWVTIPFKFE